MILRFANLDKIITFSLMSFVCFSFFSISLTQISCGVGVLAWMTKCYLTRSWGEQVFPLKIPFFLFVLACLVAVIGAVDFSGSYKSLKRLLEILIFFWVINCIESEEQREKLSLLLIVSATLSTLTAFYTAWKTGITIEARAEGTMSVYMTYAGLLMLAFLTASGKLIFAPKENKWLYFACILMVFCLLLTFTRQAWLGVFTGLVFLIWFRKKSLFWFMPAIFGILFLISPAEIKQRINSLKNLSAAAQDRNIQIRLVLWQGGWMIFKDHPLTGCGFKCVDAVHQDYPDPGAHSRFRVFEGNQRLGYLKSLRGLHNNFVQLAVDTGLFGLVSWISIWIVYFMTLCRRLVSEPDNFTYIRYAMSSAAAVVGFLVAGLFETNFYDAEVSMLLYFIMALPLSRLSNEGGKSQ